PESVTLVIVSWLWNASIWILIATESLAAKAPCSDTVILKSPRFACAAAPAAGPAAGAGHAHHAPPPTGMSPSRKISFLISATLLQGRSPDDRRSSGGGAG